MKKLLLLLVILLPVVASGQDAVEIDGIYYNLISKNQTAEVTENPNKYSGDVIIPESVTYKGVNYVVIAIADLAFFSCDNLTSITIPNSVTTIGIWAFEGCDGLTSITIPSGVTSIGESAFYGCSGLTSITIPGSVKSIGNWVFAFCTGLTSITILNGVTNIENTFFRCTALSSVILPNTLTSIGHDAFSDCTALTSITIPNNVSSICSLSFSGCTNLISIIIGSGIKEIDFYAFSFCNSLTDFYCYADNVPSSDNDAFFSSNYANATLHVPSASISSYKSTFPWNGFKNIVALTDSDPNPTDISSVNYTSLRGDVYYELSGQKIQNHQQGIYIINGKKYIKK